jgi:hypothetical protein
MSIFLFAVHLGQLRPSQLGVAIAIPIVLIEPKLHDVLGRSHGNLVDDRQLSGEFFEASESH